MIGSLLFGVAYAAADALLLRSLMKKAALTPETASKTLLRGLGARYLLTIAVLAVALLAPGLDAVWVVVPLIAQKAVLVVLALLPEKKNKP